MKATFERALSEAVTLLQDLPRRRHSAQTVRARFERFTASHPSVSSRLFTDVKPGTDEADHDLLLTDSGVGTVALSWHPDEGIPWTPLHADHWASNLVLSVDDAQTSIQSALIYLHVVLKRHPSLMEDLVNRALISAGIERSPPPVGEGEVDKAVAAFRSAQGLSSSGAMQVWLDEMHLTPEALRELVTQTLQLRKFKERLVTRRVRPYFEAHRRDFDRIAVVRLDALPRASAKSIAVAWRRSGICPALGGKRSPLRSLKGRVETLYGRDLPAEFAGQPVHSIVGPARDGDGFWVGQVLGRSSARLDRETRDRIEAVLFDEWLAQQRNKATIRWHWI